MLASELEMPKFLELVAAIAGLMGVWLTTKQIIWCWPVALINVILSFVVFYDEKLYQDAILQVFYFFMTLWGWYHWLYGGQNHAKPVVGSVSDKTLVLYLVTGFLLMLGSGFFFKNYTDADLPFWDAASLVWGIIGTIWMIKKWIESWVIWITIDIICTGIFLYKGLYFFTIQYFIFSILAIYGWVEWNKDLKNRI